MTSMATFQCPIECPEYCRKNTTTDILFKISDLYPGLTPAERAIAAEYPIQALIAYKLTWKADVLCGKRFSRSQTNDESDACRHFVLAAFMHKELGSELSQKILNAHETVSTEPEAEKAMDLANNRLGILSSEKLMKENTFNEEMVLSVFDEALNHKALIVLDPKVHSMPGVKP